MAASYSYSVILEPQEGGGFTVLVPALPEVVTEGDTEQEALANAEEAIRAILAYRREQGMAPPSDAHPGRQTGGRNASTSLPPSTGPSPSRPPSVSYLPTA